MAYENGTTMTDIEIAESFLLSDLLNKFCNAIGAKLETAEYVRKSVRELSAENARLTAENELLRAVAEKAEIMAWCYVDYPEESEQLELRKILQAAIEGGALTE